MLDYKYEDPEKALNETTQCCSKCCKNKDEKKDRYEDAADWNKARYEWLQPHLMTIRTACCLVLVGECTWIANDSKTWGPLADCVWFLSEWGVWWTMVASITPFLAQKYGWNRAAIIMHQHALTLNMLITPLFWLFLAPAIFAELSEDWNKNKLMAFGMFGNHIFPIVTSIITIMTTDMKLLKEDWPYQFVLICFYIPFNYHGTKITPGGVYPYPFDWADEKFSLVAWILFAGFAGGLYYFLCSFMHRVGKK